MSEYEVVDTDVGNIGGCGFCGRKDSGNLGYRRKVEWLKERYAKGLRLGIVRSREVGDVGTIEYTCSEQAWRPVEAEGYLFIHCLMVSRKHAGKGVGTLLLDSCLADAKKSGRRGVAVVTSSDSFMARSDLFVKAGFVSVERIGPYELLAKKFEKDAPDPRFIVDRERVLKRHAKGLAILAADQCPMIAKWVEEIAAAARALGIEPKVVRVDSAAASRELPTPYGVFCIVYDGRLIAERPISATRFKNMMRKL